VKGRKKAPRTFARTGHGDGAGTPHIEVPTDGMPAPVAAPPAAPSVPLAFRQDGRIADTLTAKELGRRGGIAKASKLRLVDASGLARIADDSAFKSYANAAKDLTAHHLAELVNVSGGHAPTSASSTMVASGALQLAGSRYAFDQFAATADPSWLKLGSQLADASRQNFLAAYSHAVLIAKAREDSDTTPDPWEVRR
jgi:hypothetical protein